VLVVDAAALTNLRWSALYSVAFTGTALLLPATTLGYPGLISGQGALGALDIATSLVNRPLWLLIITLMLATLVLALWVGGLRRWFDPEGLAADALRWVVASRRLNLALAGIVVAGLVVLGLGGAESAMVLWAVFGLASWAVDLLLPFWVWRTEVLSQARPDIGYKPFWPGGMAVFALLVSLFAYLVLPFTAVLLAFTGSFVISASYGLGVFLLSLLLPIWVALHFINRSQMRNVRADLVWALRWRYLRSWLWLLLVGVLVTSLMMLPVLEASLLSIYVMPQYQFMPLPDGASPLLGADDLSQVFMAWAHGGEGLLALPLSIFNALTLGRLLNQQKLRREGRVQVIEESQGSFQGG